MNMSKRLLRRITIGLVLATVLGLIAGYWASPPRPWVFAHLTRGSYLVGYTTEKECEAARQGFGVGRGIPTDARMTVGGDGGYVDMCLAQDNPVGVAPVRIDLAP